MRHVSLTVRDGTRQTLGYKPQLAGKRFHLACYLSLHCCTVSPGGQPTRVFLLTSPCAAASARHLFACYYSHSSHLMSERNYEHVSQGQCSTGQPGRSQSKSGLDDTNGGIRQECLTVVETFRKTRERNTAIVKLSWILSQVSGHAALPSYVAMLDKHKAHIERARAQGRRGGGSEAAEDEDERVAGHESPGTIDQQRPRDRLRSASPEQQEDRLGLGSKRKNEYAWNWDKKRGRTLDLFESLALRMH